MASNFFPIDQSAAATPQGRALLQALSDLLNAHQRILAAHDAMVQEAAGQVPGTAANCDQVVKNFGFLANTSNAATTANDTAAAAFTEIDSYKTTASAALTQMCSKFQQ